MIKDLIDNGLVDFPGNVETWEEAVLMASNTLKQEGYIEQSYVDEIIRCIKKHGPYIVLIPGVAMPHATVGSPGVNKTGMSLTIFNSSVRFDEEKEASVFFTLATNDADKHLENIQNLMELLMDDAKREAVMTARSIEDLRGL